MRQAAFEPVFRREIEEDIEAVMDRVEGHFPYPVFVKPSNAGSSRGVTKAENRGELSEGLKEAARHDRKILVEEMIFGYRTVVAYNRQDRVTQEFCEISD